jgi:hypothetical protein
LDVLPPTSPRLLEDDAIPYFLWDLGLSVAELKRGLASPSSPERDELIVRLLREANSRDVWLFVDWNAIEEAWPRVQHRLGRSRPVWELVLERHHERAAASTA